MGRPHAPSPRHRVLLAWQYGRNFGHLARLAAIETQVREHGRDIVCVLPAAHLQTTQLTTPSRDRLAAPALAGLPGPLARVTSFVDILRSLGFDDVKALRLSVEAWMRLYDTLEPASIVLDYAPVALLAACISGRPAFQVTNGFDAPPARCPPFDIGIRGPYLDELSTRNVERFSALLGIVGKAFGNIGIDHECYFDYARKVFDCVPETDPYGPRPGIFLGPLGTLRGAARLTWPDRGVHRRRAFVYLRTASWSLPLLDTLEQQDFAVICAWPDAPQQALARFSRPQIQISREPVELDDVLSCADTVISYGSSALVCKALLAGRTQIAVATELEKMLVARKLSAANLLTRAEPDVLSMHDAMHRQEGQQECVSKTSRKYQHADFQANARRFVRVLSA